MKYNPYSSSKIQKFYICPKSFEYCYIQKVKIPKKDILPLVRGLIVHKLLQYHELNLPEKILKIKEDKEISKSAHFTKDVMKECIGIYNSYIKTDIGKEFFNYKKLATEIGCGLDTKLKSTSYLGGELFRGYIDYICVDVSSNIVHILDYKTGKDKSGGMYAQTPDQLIYYATWYFENFPVDTIVINFVYVEHQNAILRHTLTRENLSKYKKLLLVNIKNIESCEEFVKNEGPLCEWCDYLEMCKPN